MIRKNMLVDLNLILAIDLSPTAKFIYQVLKTFQKGEQRRVSKNSVTITHREIVRASGLSQNTIVKALNNLESSGWIYRERNSGSANKYIFMTPSHFLKEK